MRDDRERDNLEKGITRAATRIVDRFEEIRIAFSLKRLWRSI